MGSLVEGPSIIRYRAVETHGNSVAVVSEDFGGVDLRTQLPSIRGDVQAFVGMAVQLADGLSAIHDRKLIHKDIKPGNIVVNPGTQVIKLIDFGLVSEIVRERQGPIGPTTLEGSIAYMSPEQTGRMNRIIDHRTDLYSLGVTFYEMLCGQRPFPGDDVLELIHSHLAKHPTPPHRVDPRVPRVLSDIIMKLLAKNAEDRYQSAQGLRADLLRCQQSLRDPGAVPEFELGADDRAGTLQVSQRLHGRGSHKRSLLEAFERAGAGGRELVLVGGPAGVGKSSLIAEMHRPMTARRGYFISGKGDMLAWNVPYGVLLQAFQSLLQELLTESEPRLERWRERLIEALGPNAGVLVEVLPELALIVGEQPTPPAVGAAEAQRRFDQTFLHFARVFAGAEHPLVMFLDDLQWVDGATFRLLRQLLTASECTHLLVVGAYRDEHVGRAHSLTLTAAELREAGGSVSDIELDALEIADVTRLVADTLGCGLERARPLAELVYDKTLGNPYFIGELLRSLHDDGRLWLEHGVWRWDEDQIQARAVSPNVVGLLVDKVRLLSEHAQQSLRLAACVGGTFTLRPLSLVTGISLEDTARSLREAIRAGLVQPLGELYKQAELGMDEGAAARYRFTHDRVQEAAYSLLPAEERPAVHWRVGKLLLEDTPADQHDVRVFDIVNQLDQGMVLAKTWDERVWLARLNLRAGRRAAASMAHGPALVYLQNGIELLGDEGFTRDYELALGLHTEACAAAQASADLAAMDRYAELVLTNASSLLDRLRVYETKIAAYNATSQFAQSLALGLEVLDLLGTRFPAEPSPGEVYAATVALRSELRGREIEELLALPLMEDPEKRAAMRILVALVMAAYAAKRLLFPLLAVEAIKTSLEYGNAPESPLGYSNFGAACCSEGIADYETAERLGRLALLLLDRLDAQHLRPNVELMVRVVINPWTAPLASSCAPLRVAAQVGLSNGNFESSGHCLHAYGMFAFFSGRALDPLEDEVAANAASQARLGQHTSVTWMGTYLQSIRNLRGHGGERTHLRGVAYDEREMFPVQVAQKDGIGLFHAYINTVVLSYLFRDYERALEYAEKLWDTVGVVLGFMFVLFHGYDALARLAMVEQVSEDERERLMERIEVDREALLRAAEAAPMNNRHRWLLVEAEWYRVEGRVVEAIDAYDEAIAQATSNGFHNDAALANERAAEFWLARNKIEVATAYARVARYEYERWGATAKVADLDDRYHGIAPRVGALAEGSVSAESVSSDSLRLTDSLHLDMGSVFKATRVLSEEMDVRKVVSSLMKIVIENAGANRGYLLLDEAGTLTIQASGSIDNDTVVVAQSEPGPAAVAERALSEAIVRYVVRTGEPLVLHDAVSSGLFTRDPHIRRSGARSVLCMPFSAPMVSQRSTAGVLYLENADTVNVFSHDRVRVLKLITAQAAISLENARLYGELKEINANLEGLVAERTKELRDAQRALVRASRKVGQAEVAENLLHNVGNLLNSLTVSCGMLRDVVRQPAARVLTQLVERVRAPEHELAEVFASTEQGALVIELLGSVDKALAGREHRLKDIANTIGWVVGEFVQVLRKHDAYLTEVTLVQAFLLGTLLDDAIASSGVGQHSWLRLRTDYGRHPLLHNDQYGLERLVVALLRHLGQAAAAVATTGEVVTLSVVSHWTGQEVDVTIGIGDPSEGRVASTEMFQQRSTSHPDMPSLHDCANTAAKLGGTLTGYVGGTGTALHFVLSLGVGAPSAAPAPAGR